MRATDSHGCSAFDNATSRTRQVPGVSALLVLFALSTPAPAADLDARSGIVSCANELVNGHNPNIVVTTDRLVCYPAYVSQFNTQGQLIASGQERYLGVPAWTIQRVQRKEPSKPEIRSRPRVWWTIPDLRRLGIAPTDGSYRFSSQFRRRNTNWYERGQLTPKYLAERVSSQAGLYTHTVANAVPQRARFKKGAWRELDCYTGAWANKFETVYVVTGPILLNPLPHEWLESDVERRALPVAIPDALFKIVAKKHQTRAGERDAPTWDVLAFIYPQNDPSYDGRGPWDPARRLVPVARIEELTHQRFFPTVDAAERRLKAQPAPAIWPVGRENFDLSCQRFMPRNRSQRTSR